MMAIQGQTDYFLVKHKLMPFEKCYVYSVYYRQTRNNGRKNYRASGSCLQFLRLISVFCIHPHPGELESLFLRNIYVFIAKFIQSAHKDTPKGPRITGILQTLHKRPKKCNNSDLGDPCTHRLRRSLPTTVAAKTSNPTNQIRRSTIAEVAL